MNIPTRYVDKKIEANGIQVPMILLNMIKLFCMINAAKKKSVPAMKIRKIHAVMNGDV